MTKTDRRCCLCGLLLRQSPDHDRKIRIVAKRAPPAMRSPGAKVGLHARAVAPGGRFDALHRKAALGQQVFDSQFGPAAAIDWVPVDFDQKWGADQEVPARIEHLINMATRSIRPEQVLENLLGDDQ